MAVSAGIIRNPQGATLIALVNMAPQLCCSADLDRPHHTLVTNGHLMTMNLAIGRPKSPKQIGHL
jgi:hypothetical protein